MKRTIQGLDSPLKFFEDRCALKYGLAAITPDTTVVALSEEAIKAKKEAEAAERQTIIARILGNIRLLPRRN